MMNKFGVDEDMDSEMAEQAQAQGCPICHSPVKRDGNVVRCPKHGSAPFERRSDGSEKSGEGST